ncbi:MAG: prolipoprotein diacylglyceryl transferase [Bellilinea sp.]
MLPVVQVGPLVLQTPGLILILGVWVALTAVDSFAKKNRMDANLISNLVLLMLAAGIIGARLSYAAANLPAFSGNWRSILSLTPTMLDPIGGLAAGLITGLIYGQRKHLNLWTTLDTLTPGLAIFMVFSGLADLASGEGLGVVTDLPWGITLWGEKRHPAQIYSIISALAIAAVFYWQQRKFPRSSGTLFLTWLSLTAFMRILLEPFRADGVVWAGGIRSAQIVALIILAAALILLGKRLRPIQSSNTESPDRISSGGEG